MTACSQNQGRQAGLCSEHNLEVLVVSAVVVLGHAAVVGYPVWSAARMSKGSTNVAGGRGKQ